MTNEIAPIVTLEIKATTKQTVILTLLIKTIRPYLILAWPRIALKAPEQTDGSNIDVSMWYMAAKFDKEIAINEKVNITSKDTSTSKLVFSFITRPISLQPETLKRAL